jgi:hypothetical protein
MICRIAFHEKTPGPIDSEEARSFRDWAKSQPGFVEGWHGACPRTGRAVSFTVWESEEHLLALREKVPPGGPIGMKPVQVEIFPDIRHF